MHPQIAADLRQCDLRIYVRAQTDPQSAQLWWPGRGAVCLAGPGRTDRRTDRQTDGSQHQLMPTYGGGIITDAQKKIGKSRILYDATEQSRIDSHCQCVGLRPHQEVRR